MAGILADKQQKVAKLNSVIDNKVDLLLCYFVSIELIAARMRITDTVSAAATIIHAALLVCTL